MKQKEKTVKKILPYGLWDFSGLQNWLNAQAKDGYAFQKSLNLSFFDIACFRKDSRAPQSRYCLDPIHESADAYESQQRRKDYEAYGWHFVGSIGKLYAVYRCDDSDAPILYTDPQSLALAMKKQVRRTWFLMLFEIVWLIILFRKELALLPQWSAEFWRKPILQTELMVPFYIILFALAVTFISESIGIFLGMRRMRTLLAKGEWPKEGHRYAVFVRNLICSVLLIASIVFWVYQGISGESRPKGVPDAADWVFPHILLEEVLPEGAVISELYGQKELLRGSTLASSFLAPVQYDTVQGGQILLADGQTAEARLYQQYIQTHGTPVAKTLYQAELTAFRHSLENYRQNWEENTSSLHQNQPNAYAFLEEETFTAPAFDALTRFTYQFSEEETKNTVYIGLREDCVWILKCFEAADGDAALEKIMQRIQAEEP